MAKTAKRRPDVKINRCNPKTRKQDKGQCLPIRLPDVPGCAPEDEHCRLDAAPLPEVEKRRLRKEYLRPRYPVEWKNDPDMWLSNYDIEAVMKQYQEAEPTFRFVGIFPIDFSAPDPYRKGETKCLHPELCELDLKAEHARGIRQLGMVFNLDPHFKGGSHWMALYVCLRSLRRPWAAFFDSYGYQTPPLIARLMRAFRRQLPTMKLMYNARRFQYGGTECGMYSLYFLITMMAGMSFARFCKHAVPDGEMLRLRKILFTA